MIGVVDINRQQVKLKPWEVVQVADNVGIGYLNNYGSRFAKVESVGESDEKLLQENKALKTENEALKKKITELLAKKEDKPVEEVKESVPANPETPAVPETEEEVVDTELEELTALYCEVTCKSKVPNNKKRDKQRIKEQIDKQKLLQDTTNA